MNWLNLALALLFAACSAQAVELSFDQSTSKLAFIGDYQGEPVPGEFKQFRGTVQIGEDGAAVRFKTEIQVGSLDTDYPDRDETLRGDEFFDALTHPLATWASTGDCSMQGDTLNCPGSLRLKGVEKPVALTLSAGDEGSPLVGVATINRLDFGIGGGDWKNASDIAHAIQITFSLQAR